MLGWLGTQLPCEVVGSMLRGREKLGNPWIRPTWRTLPTRLPPKPPQVLLVPPSKQSPNKSLLAGVLLLEYSGC